jgi:hypothetical protein
LLLGFDVARVRIAVGRGVGVEHPDEAAVCADDDEGVVIVDEIGRERLRAGEQVAAHEHAAVRRHVVGEGQLRQVVERPAEREPVQTGADADAARAFVDGVAVRVALRIVELLLPRVDVHVRVGF